MAENVVTPVGDLTWVFITDEGKKDLNGNDRYSANVEFHKDSEEFKTIEGKIEAFWEANKPKGAKQKSNGIKVVQEKQADDSYEDTDMRSVSFWTGKTYNAKGSEVALGGKKIGNGSRGAISGAMAIYDQSAAARGVTLYLNAIQITKFDEFKGGGANFADTGVEDGFTGFEDEADGFSAQPDDGAAKPRLQAGDLAPRYESKLPNSNNSLEAKLYVYIH